MRSDKALRVLVVDDEPGMRSGVMRVLRDFRLEAPGGEGELGFVVEEASSGEQALAMLEAEPPDIILLDHKLPGISGMEILGRLEKGDHDFLVIVVTAYASLEMAVRATKHGAHDLLAKPFAPDELRSTVAKTAKHLLLRRRARQLDEERRQTRFRLLSVLAHELKAPLSAAQSYLGILDAWPVAERLDEYRHITQRCMLRIEGMRKLILDLLDLTRIESGTKQRKLEALDLERAASEALELFRAEAGKRNIALALHADCQGTFEADRQEIDMIFNNLLSNAIKYNRQDGSVDLRVDVSPQSVCIEVQDTGIGMTPEEISRLFAEFARIKNEKTEQIVGSGLGLHLLKKIASLYGGQVDVASTPEVGSTFRVVLPNHGG